MKMSDKVHIAAPVARVWEGLNDAAVLKDCIPGCESLEKRSANEFEATAAVRVGPVQARFKGSVTLSDLDPPNGYRISGEGSGGAAGFAKGAANVRLVEADGGTDLTYEVDATVGGKLAQIGQRFIDQTAKKMADDFFAKFAEVLTAPPAPAIAAPIAEAARPPKAAGEQTPPRVIGVAGALTGFRPKTGASPNRPWLLAVISAIILAVYFWFIATYG